MERIGKSRVQSLSLAVVWKELQVLSRLLYRAKNQHRRDRTFQKLLRVRSSDAQHQLHAAYILDVHADKQGTEALPSSGCEWLFKAAAEGVQTVCNAFVICTYMKIDTLCPDLLWYQKCSSVLS